MQSIIRGMEKKDRSYVIEMMREFGKPCIWIEDIYIKDEYRGLEIGSSFLNYIERKYPNSVFRLEVEAENKRAIKVYNKCGYEILSYMEMKK